MNLSRPLILDNDESHDPDGLPEPCHISLSLSINAVNNTKTFLPSVPRVPFMYT